jgi:hypothetical protein
MVDGTLGGIDIWLGDVEGVVDGQEDLIEDVGGG